MKILKLLFIGLLPFFLFSCVNEEGEGGTSSVEGYVFRIVHPDGEYNFETDTFPAARADVYIRYGDKTPYGDKMDVDFDGQFKFDFLSKGTYKVYAYNKYPDGHEEAVFSTVNVAKGKTAKADTIFIHEGKMFGKSYIKGTLLADYYDKTIKIRTDVPAAGSRVYIQKKGIDVPFDDIRAGSDGVFMFQKLPVGEYIIYAESEDEDRVIYVEESSKIEVKITQEGKVIEIAEPIKIKCRS